MSKDWTPEELNAVSDAMKRAGQMSYEEFTKEVEAIDKIVRFARKQREYNFPCPRCGLWAMDKDPIRNALSRRVNVYICNFCGTAEAMEDYFGEQKKLSEWEISLHDASRFHSAASSIPRSGNCSITTMRTRTARTRLICERHSYRAVCSLVSICCLFLPDL